MKKNIEVNKETIKIILNKFINSIWFPIIIGMILLLKTIFFYQNTIAIRETIENEVIIGSIAFIITFICVICAFPNKTRGILTIILDIILSILLFADNIYYIYSSSVLSIAQITNLQYGEEIIGTIPMLIELKHIIYFIDIILLIILLLVKAIEIEEKEKASWKVNLLKVVSVIIAICLIFIVDTKYEEKAKEFPYNKDAQINVGTIYGYHITDIERLINIKKSAKYKNKEDML